jgi:hypothetical protein
MNVEFIGYALSDRRIIKSRCILQKMLACQDRVFLMEEDRTNWTEVDPDTVKQTKYENNDRGEQK